MLAVQLERQRELKGSLRAEGAAGIFTRAFQKLPDAEGVKQDACFVGLNIHRRGEQLQVVLCSDFLQLLYHFPAAAAVGPPILGRYFRFLDIIHDTALFLLPAVGVPFYKRLLVGPLGGKHRLQRMGGHRHDRPVFVVDGGGGVAIFPDLQVLEPQRVHHRAAHQQQGQGDNGRDQPQLPFRQTVRVLLSLPEFLRAEDKAALHIIQPDQNIHGVHTYPSSLSFLRSFPRLLWSMEATLLWLKPVILAIVSMESMYQ